MTAFKQVLNNLQAGQREEAMIGLEFVLRLDPSFGPATHLKRQLASSPDEIDLGDIIAQLQAPTTDAIDGLLIEAVDDFNSREFLTAKEKVEKVLIDLPGHQEARDLRDQIDKALKIESQVGQFLIQAREALAKDDPQEAANFVMMAQALDPHHTGIATTLKEIDDTGGLALSQDSPEETSAEPAAAGTPPVRPVTTGPGSSEAAGGETPFPEAAPTQPGQEPVDHSEDPFEQEAFAVEFDTSDPFADVIESNQEPSPAEAEPGFAVGDGDATPDFGMPAQEPTPEFGMGAEDSAPDFGTGDDGDMSFPAMEDTADLFTAPSTAPGVDPSTSPDHGGGYASDDPASFAGEIADEGSVATSIDNLIAQGRAALDRGDQPQAISIWSRIFLVKPTHPEAGHLIERAKKSLAAIEAEVEDLLGKARDAFDEGELDAARLLVTKALSRRPNHIEVTILREHLDREQGVSEDPARTAAVPPAAPDLPELDDDLFSDPTVEAAAEAPRAETDAAAVDSDDDLFRDDDDDFDDFDDFEEPSLIGRLRSKLSVRVAAVAGVALIVVLAGVWMGGKFLATEPEVDDSAAVTEVLVEADRLFKEHKVEEALHLLREFPASGLSQQRIDMRIAKYEKDLAPPTPTPVPEHAVNAERLLEQGLWWSAFASAGEGLVAHPDDPQLAEIRQIVVESEPEAPALEQALRTRNFRTAVSITEDLVVAYPKQGDLRVVLERSLFNAALAESRAYNLTGAENHLLRLLELKPEDEEAARFLEFVRKYKVRAADMRLEIFIRSLNER
jgi:tetratricopeptide (TPR) repeat protein